MTTLHTVSFQRTVLATMVGLCLSQSVFALESLEQLDDSALSQATGEGIALLPENFSMVLQGANDDPATWAAAPGDRTQDTGYIRAIPVGPLTPEAQAAGAGKADLYLYGLGISQSKRAYGAARDASDYGERFSANNPVTSWGSAENPWLLKVTTENNVPNFSATSPTDTGSGAVSYLTLETPLYHNDTDGDLLNGNQAIAGLSPALQSAYNLKLGLWADAFVRDPTVLENLTATGTQFDLGGAGRANRMRMQAIWDGLGINGTNLKFFQTLGGATNAGGMSTSYNHTLGVSGVVRLNSGDAQNLAATYTEATRYYGGTVTNGVYGGGGSTTAADSQYEMSDTNTFGCGSASLAFGVATCEYRFRSRNVSDVVSNGTWTPPTVSSVLRLSTQETTDTALLSTPAINGGAAPTFNTTEGLFLYNPNINLVLGTLYQPLTFGVAPDGKNLVIELARIPNKESIYKKIYTNYDDSNVATNGGYSGSTCNIYQCGTNGTTEYQGNNATHSSITIGSTLYDPVTNTLSARKDNGAVGVSFGPLVARTGINESKSYKQWQDQQRQLRRRVFDWTDKYEVYDRDRTASDSDRRTDPYTGNVNDCDNYSTNSCRRTIVNNGTVSPINEEYTCGTFGQSTCTRVLPGVQTSKGYHLDWAYRTTGNADVGGTCTTSAYAAAGFCGVNGQQTDTWITATAQTDSDAAIRDYTGRATTAANLDWAQQSPNWADSTARSIAVRNTLTSPAQIDVIPTNPTSSITMSPLNNFGSVAIDGLLINHMKITTKGL